MNGNGVPMPMGGTHQRTPSGPYNIAGRGYGGADAFVGARSPPKTKSTSHVPCRFYPIGQCQAGAACQFSHDLDPTTQNAPCKYFAKGSCKFGQNCALAHVLPDGRVINRARGNTGAFNRRATQAQQNMAGPPNSLLSMQANDPLAQQDHLAYGQQDPYAAYPGYSTLPVMGGDLRGADFGSPYGSPHGDDRLAASPHRAGLSALDAPMPKSFDSQGISHAARHGPFASSVPSRFGIESPPSSLPNKAQMGNTSIRDSTYGDTPNLDGVLHGLGSSPRESTALDFSKRPLHSERFARSRPMLMSSSLGIRSSGFHPDTSESEASTDDGAGEDLLPSSLHDLLPQERLRRPSRNAIDDEGSFLPVMAGQRRAISNGTTIQENKVGSLSPHGGSPSRYSSIWAAKSNNNKTDLENNPSVSLGHVGSPLRPSSLRTSSMGFSSSPNSATSMTRPGDMSMLTSQLQRIKVTDGNKSNTLHPGATRTTSNSSLGRGGLGDRGFSSTSLGREKIDEETMFSMEDEEDSSLSMAFRQSFSNATLGPIGGQRTNK